MNFKITRRQFPFAFFGTAAAALEAHAADTVADFFKGRLSR